MLHLAERQIQFAFEQAQKEVDDLHQRTHEGIATAKQVGGLPGKKLNMKKSELAKKLIETLTKSLLDGGCMKRVSASRNRYYRYKSEL